MYIFSRKFDDYYAQLQVMHGIKFTVRQIDVVSCIVNARTKYKEIANILGIEVTVVRSHISAIRAKIRNTSNSDIIQFVENSTIYDSIKNHFIFLLKVQEFDNLLKNIAKASSQKEEIIIYLNKDKDTEIILSNGKNFGLKKHFSNLNIKIELRDINKDTKGKGSNNIFIITDTLIEKANKNSITLDNIKKTISNSNGKNVILKLCSIPSDHLTLEGKNIEVIDFSSDYCSNFLHILSYLDLIPNNSLKKSVGNFIKSGFCKDALLGVNNSNIADNRIETVPKSNARRIIKFGGKSLFAAVFFTFFLFISAIYLFNHQNTEDQKPELWNISILHENMIHRQGIVDQIWNQLKYREYENTATSIVGLYGLGGIGKTTLANYIVHNPQKKYSFIGWFNAENANLLKNGYIDLGIKHNLISQKMTTSQKIYEVKEWIESQKNILLVFDGVQDINILSKYLPNKGDIIITSRSYNIPKALEVDILTEEESVLLLKNLIPNLPRNSDDSELKALAKKLDYIPLALTQAGAYIAKNMLSIKEYSILYDTHSDSLLKDSTMPALDDHKPIHVTWNISIQKLKNHPQGKKPLQLLNFISCCDHSYFSKKFLALFLYGNYEPESMLKLNKVLHNLRNYSFVKTTSNGVIVHNLVHSWVYSNLENKKELYLRAISTIKKIHQIKILDWDEDLIRLSLPHFQKIVKAARRYVSKKEYVDLLLMEGDFLFYLGYYNSNSKILEEALSIQENNLNNTDLKVVSIINKMIKNSLKLGKFREALELIDRALIAEDKIVPKDNIEHAFTLGHQGRIYRYLGKYEESLEILRKSLSIREKHYGKNSPELINTMSSLGATYGSLGDYRKSLELLEKSKALLEKHYSPDHAQIIYTLNRLGNRYRTLGYYDKSIECLTRSLEIQKKYLPSDNIVSSYTLRQFSKVYNDLGEYNKALDYITQSIEMEEKCIGKKHYYSADPITQLGIVHRKLGNYPKSLELIKKAYNILKNDISKDNLKIAYSYHHMALTYRELGDLNSCIDLLKKSLTIKTKSLGANNIIAAKDMLELGITYKMQNNYNESFRLISKAEQILSKNLGANNVRALAAKRELELLEKEHHKDSKFLEKV